jgi:hypothetical protein
MVMWPVLNPTTLDGDPVGSKYDSWAPIAPDTISNAGCMLMDLASSSNRGSTSVVVESSEVNSDDPADNAGHGDNHHRWCPLKEHEPMGEDVSQAT